MTAPSNGDGPSDGLPSKWLRPYTRTSSASRTNTWTVWHRLCGTRLRFWTQVSKSPASRRFRGAGWPRKMARRMAQEPDADLRDFYLHNVTSFHYYHLLRVDESGCGRRSGRSVLGMTFVRMTCFHRRQQCQILTTYTQTNVLLFRVLQGATDWGV